MLQSKQQRKKLTIHLSMSDELKFISIVLKLWQKNGEDEEASFN